ncbi:hypothetical protein EN829_014985 [Mesorhizobium sp. M00.F.Ca.ET.186.01.1.1]|nr:hypothetical protein EN848_14450 [bacterium M00.F.Ca.ET.205.01.1.1]TGU52988.1 hypothetical protein EN795_14945 [bacterium M00.F.Ca.ET.152.01.1.1]TGV35957.1 hypothetical protein EN829_014985 [Mesorhizobium sp. M00.F.Ca.ET.186.01.1.1]TGZ43540.1 hypothetical protein EN805_10555 [bacterium M00.F.Ca.ET.162.01.1.1]
MAYTQSQIDALKKTIASGVLTFKHGETLTQFQSLAEMRALLREMEASVVGGTEAPRRTVAGYSSGL